MKKIYILFDVPDDRNDKAWLIEGLKETYSGRVESIPINHVLSKMIMLQGGLQRVKAYGIIFSQCIRTLGKSSKGDIVICWFSTTGKIFNFISRVWGNSRLIVSMNWLNPGGKQKGVHYRLARFAATNDKCTIVVNTPTKPALWNSYLSCTKQDYLVVPDVFDDTESFSPIKNSFEKVAFSGGYGNRDWALLMRVASKLSNWHFICVAQESDFRSKVVSIPANVEVHFNIEALQYYELMKSSSIVVLPIIGNTISGLVNIIKAAQYGILCSVSKTDSTIQYYSENDKDLLFRDENELNSVLSNMSEMSISEYQNKTSSFQKYIKESFSPTNALGILKSRLDKLIEE